MACSVVEFTKPGVFLFEDHKIARASFLLPDCCRKVSTRAFLQFLEQKNWIPSAVEVERRPSPRAPVFSDPVSVVVTHCAAHDRQLADSRNTCRRLALTKPIRIKVASASPKPADQVDGDPGNPADNSWTEITESSGPVA
jgi:hypothetical protein